MDLQDLHQQIKQIRDGAAGGVDPHAFAPNDGLLCAALLAGVPVTELLWKGATEVRMLLHNAEGFPLYADGDIENIFQGTRRRIKNAAERPMRPMIECALCIGLKIDDILGKGIRDLGEMIEREINRIRRERNLPIIGGIQGCDGEYILDVFSDPRKRVRREKNTPFLAPSGALTTSAQKLMYPIGTVVAFKHGGSRTGESEGTAKILGENSKGYVEVEVLSITILHGNPRVSCPGVRKLHINNIRGVAPSEGAPVDSPADGNGTEAA